MKNAISVIVCGALFTAAVGTYLSKTQGIRKDNIVENVLFRGVPSDLVLCEGDSMELRVREGKLLVDCADRRKVPVALIGAGGTVSNFDLNCLSWCQYLLDVKTASWNISNSIFSNPVISGADIKIDEQPSKEK